MSFRMPGLGSALFITAATGDQENLRDASYQQILPAGTGLPDVYFGEAEGQLSGLAAPPANWPERRAFCASKGVSVWPANLQYDTIQGHTCFWVWLLAKDLAGGERAYGIDYVRRKIRDMVIRGGLSEATAQKIWEAAGLKGPWRGEGGGAGAPPAASSSPGGAVGPGPVLSPAGGGDLWGMYDQATAWVVAQGVPPNVAPWWPVAVVVVFSLLRRKG